MTPSDTELPSSGDSSATETPRDLPADKEAAVHYVSLSEIPKRKPVPVITSAPIDYHPTPKARVALLYANLLSRYRGLDTRKRRLVIILVIGGVVALLGLIIGLSVGLTVGKKYVYLLVMRQLFFSPLYPPWSLYDLPR